jgi:hypothetical protein
LDIHLSALGDWVPDFVRVSNRMAGIDREPTPAEISAHRGLLAANALRVENLEMFVHHIAKGAHVRDNRSDDDAPSAAELKAALATIVLAAQKRAASPQRLHRIYTMLNPFTRGNGRCGRALLMWQVMRAGERERPQRGSMHEAAERPRNSTHAMMM